MDTEKSTSNSKKKLTFRNLNDSEKKEYFRRYYLLHRKPKTARTFVKFDCEDIAFIVQHADTMKAREMAEYFGCSDSAIYYQLKKRHLGKYKNECKRSNTIISNIIQRNRSLNIDNK